MSTPKITGLLDSRELSIHRLIEIEEEITSLVAEAKGLVARDEYEQLKHYWAAKIMVS